jgi:hypothetical protein
MEDTSSSDEEEDTHMIVEGVRLVAPFLRTNYRKSRGMCRP